MSKPSWTNDSISSNGPLCLIARISAICTNLRISSAEGPVLDIGSVRNECNKSKQKRIPGSDFGDNSTGVYFGLYGAGDQISSVGRFFTKDDLTSG
jgi:hypothetical protein